MTARKPAKKPSSPKLAARIAPLLWGLEHGTNAVKKEAGSNQTEYTRHCLALLDNPANIAKPEWRAIIIEILRKYVADNPVRNPTATEIAYLVDQLMLLGNRSATAARREVAEAIGKSFDAVKIAHNKFRSNT